MEYDKSKKHSRWIAFRFDNQTKQQNVSRSDEPFDADPAIGSQYQRVQADFGKQGYDRGHLCASADRLYSREVNEQTFYYTGSSSNLVVISFLFQLSSSFLILLKVVDMFAF